MVPDMHYGRPLAEHRRCLQIRAQHWMRPCKVGGQRVAEAFGDGQVVDFWGLRCARRSHRPFQQSLGGECRAHLRKKGLLLRCPSASGDRRGRVDFLTPVPDGDHGVVPAGQCQKGFHWAPLRFIQDEGGRPFSFQQLCGWGSRRGRSSQSLEGHIRRNQQESDSVIRILLCVGTGQGKIPKFGQRSCGTLFDLRHHPNRWVLPGARHHVRMLGHQGCKCSLVLRQEVCDLRRLQHKLLEVGRIIVQHARLQQPVGEPPSEEDLPRLQHFVLQ